MPFNLVSLQKKRDYVTCYPPHALPQKVITTSILQGNMNVVTTFAARLGGVQLFKIYVV